MDRRQFLRRGGALLGGAGLAGVLAACGSSPVAAKTGGTLKIASGEADGPAGTIDPAFFVDDPDATRICLVYERLTYLSESFQAVPQLATSWSSNATGDVWTFNLRHGVVFHDGTPFTAKDVVYTYQRLVDPTVGSPGAAQLSNVDSSGVEAVGDHQVRFQLKAPDVEFPLTIANPFTYIIKDGLTGSYLRTHAIGTGPFKLERFVPNQQPTTFTKNQHYWQAGLPKVDAVSLYAIPEESSLVSAIISGQIDITWEISLASATYLRKSPKAKVLETKSPFYIDIACWCDTPPFDDVRVRQALKYAVDRKQMESLILGAYGEQADDDPVAPWVQYGLQVTPRKRDIGKAKQLLSEAGHATGIDVDLYTSDATDGMVEMATIFKQQAAAAGIRVNIQQADASTYWTDVWLVKPFMCSSWSGRPAGQALATPYLSGSQWNETHWKVPAFDKLISKAQATTDSGQRGDYYKQAQQLLIDDGGALIPVYMNALGATRSNVAGWTPGVDQNYKDFRHVTVG